MILFVGDPLVDIIAKVDENFLKKYNLKPDRATRCTPELEGIFDDILTYDPILHPGGSVINTTRVLQWISRKSYPITFLGAIGDDDLAKIIRNKFAEEEILAHLVEIPHQKTGTCAVLLTGDYRSLVCHMGASKFLSAGHLDEVLWNQVSKVDYLYLSASVPRILENCRDTISTIATLALQQPIASVMILFVGGPLVDIIAKVDENFLKKYNLKPDRATRCTPELEGIFNDILTYDPILQPGGSVTNTTRVLQWISRKAYPITFLGAIGDDDLAKIIRNKFAEEEIHVHLVEIPNQKTGTCAVLLTGDYRSLVCHMGASKFLSAGHLDEVLWNQVSKADYLYLSAFLIGPNLSIIKELVKHFMEHNKFIIFNLAATFLSDKYPNEVSFLFRNADMVFGNESEFLAFSNISKVQNANINDLLLKVNKQFNNKPLRTLIMTRGNKSVFVLNNNVLEEFEIDQLEEDKIVDTNGAGDAFVGGYLAQYLKGGDVHDSVKCGMWASREIIQNHGCNFDNKKAYDCLCFVIWSKKKVTNLVTQ